MVPEVKAQGQSQAASRRITGHHHLSRPVVFFLNQPLVGVNYILQGRRIRVLRRHPVIHGQHVPAIAEPAVAHGKLPVNILHGAYISASVKLKHHPAGDHSLRLKILHFKGFPVNDFILVARWAYPGRFHGIFPELPCLDGFSQGRFHDVVNHITHQRPPYTHIFITHTYLYPLCKCRVPPLSQMKPSDEFVLKSPVPQKYGQSQDSHGQYYCYDCHGRMRDQPCGP